MRVVTSVAIMGVLALHAYHAKSHLLPQQSDTNTGAQADILNLPRARRALLGSIVIKQDNYNKLEHANERPGGSLRGLQQRNLPSSEESFDEPLIDETEVVSAKGSGSSKGKGGSGSGRKDGSGSGKGGNGSKGGSTDGPPAGSVPLYDPVNPWTSMAGYTPFSVEQPFGQDLTDANFGPDGLKRAKKFVEDGMWLYCGNAEDPYGFHALLEDLVPGTAHFPGACGDNEEANAFVNQGLTLRYAFNDNEAICSHRMAQKLAPDCALAYLFEALSAGPNVNYATIESPLAYRAILGAMTEAQALLEPVRDETVLEKVVDFYDALMLRYVPPGETLGSMLAINNDQERLDKFQKTYTGVSSEAYAGKMAAIHEKYPDDNDLAAVAVGALMQSPSWRWWQPGSEYQLDSPDSLASAPILQTVKQYPNATKANTILKNILARDPNHLGANHYMIHNMEMGPAPEWALAVADRIWEADPRDGHITHMASHIYSRVGFYSKVLTTNKISNQVDFNWNKMRTGGGLMTTLYKYEPHNTEFLVVAGWNAGNFAESAAHVALLSQMSAFRITAKPSLGSLTYKLTYGMQIALKFGLWERIVEDTAESGTAPFGPLGEIPLMDGTELVCSQCYDWVKFARTIALARLGRVEEAEAALDFYVYNVSSVPKNASNSRTQNIDEFAKKMFSEGGANVDTTSTQATGTLTINNGDRLVAVRALFANAEVLRAQGNRVDATAAYRTAWEYQKILFYDEPTPFFVPIAETLGGFLLGEGTPEAAGEAADLFRQVLFVHPMAIRAVLGLEEALRQQDGFTGRTDAVEIQFLVDHVLQHNDTAIDLYDML